MTRNGKILAGLGLTVIVLAACDGSDGVIAGPALLFGQAFAAAFNADPKDQPSENLTITYQGVNGINLTALPIDI